uniref:lysM and putative peptidoglycan-binding domain-containing protein 4-like n=1 Tax=Oncorhynchus gorbuscha TaxID=8017 RepID=UPI001EAF5E48|nr:lysM and putative peptidoglycan-binding domain-containing protein 4-like [Oncorhynchus gorbuscha]XP_046207440.1 lysM and putative peptidoglycan-binding domain-containing protein 4-like [Oncorhynchus gorbuscha]XP_046207449.1 lysM and putative peptidoglycan-binding domain-containing protein 4-like [Oncorhynchus gorbuscha]XP_046207460.1 lysM and putative peptidoglycan-binding domain-containing protein 4-like [Oncorhynchus gorbuscha]
MRRGDPVPRAFQAPVDVHASVDGQVYMFRRGQQNDSAGSSEEEEFNVMELRPRGWQELEQDRCGSLMLLERDVLVGDNLNKLALQYGCKVADIKRVNNLIQEQDIFALKSIKIPVKKHSLLTEANTELKVPDPGASNSATPLPQPQGKLTARFPGRPHLLEYTDYLKEVDHDIERLIQTTNAQDEVFLEAAERPEKLGSRGQRLTSYGADWGIQWWNAVVAMLLIGIILPVFYVVYIKTQDTGVPAAVASSNSSGTGLSTDSPRSTFSSQESVSLSLNKPNT